MAAAKADERYGIQMLDCYNNKTHPNGRTGMFRGHNARRLSCDAYASHDMSSPIE